MTRPTTAIDRAAVLVEIGWLHDAELGVAEALDKHPDDLRALGLFAKVKHIRGELSQTIGCWARMYVVSGRDRAAATQLAALLHLADDPERGAAELLLGKQARLGSPAAELALEQAFRQLRAGNPDEARATCVAVAAKYRTINADAYKLAVLAIAWISELSGHYEDAAAFLERLGKERGFELDRDRLIALERVYRAVDTPARLEAAVKICQHLERDESNAEGERLQFLAELAALYVRLGREAEAETYAQRYSAAFRAYMHRPSFADTLRAAAASYVPLQRLARVHFYTRSLPADATQLQRHLAAALAGDVDTARAHLAGATEVLDRKYLAELCAMAEDYDAAESAYIALAQTAPDLDSIGWLLDRWLQNGSARVARFLATREHTGRAQALLEAEMRRAPLRPSLWRQLAALHDINGAAGDAVRCRERAALLEQRSLQRSHPIGRVLSASVYHFIGTAKGLIHEVWAQRTPCEPGAGGTLAEADILGNITPDMKAGVRNVFYAVREYAVSKFPGRARDVMDYTYTFKLPKEDEPSGGLSAGVPVAMAFMSVFLQRPVRQAYAFTGILVADAHDVMTLRRVGEVRHKVFAAYHRNLSLLVVPGGNRPEVQADVHIPPEIAARLVRYANSLDDAIKLTWGADVFIDHATAAMQNDPGDTASPGPRTPAMRER